MANYKKLYSDLLSKYKKLKKLTKKTKVSEVVIETKPIDVKEVPAKTINKKNVFARRSIRKNQKS